MTATLFILVTLNLVMIEENGNKVNVPAQLVYDSDHPILQLHFLDTVERYNVEKISKFRGGTIIRFSKNETKGFIRVVSSGVARDLSGQVWFYMYKNHKYTDRKFIIDSNKCYSLVKKNKKKK